MQIKSYNKNELNEFIHSEFFRVLNKVPISFHRGWSQYNNPYCADEDIILWAAYENADLVGYVGVLPDIINSEGVEKKIYWLSCFWVEEKFRNGQLASQLFFLLIKQYKNRLFISNFLYSLEKTYLNLGISQKTQYNKGRKFYINFCFADLLQARYPDLKSTMTFYKLFERTINELLKFRKFIHKKRKRKYRVIEDNKLDNELITFFETFKSSHQKSVIRDIRYFNWVIDFPWVLKGKTDKESDRYYFSSKSEQFVYRILKIYHQQQPEGFVLLKIRDKNLTVSHIYARDEHIGSIAGYLIDLSLNELINTISTTDHRLMNRLRAKRTNFIYIKNFKRPYIFPRNYDISSSVFQDGDGDAVFT